MPEEVHVATGHSIVVGQPVAAVVKSYIGLKQTRTATKMVLLGAASLRLGDNDFRSIISRTLESDGVTVFVVNASSGRADATWRRRAQLDQATAKLTEVVKLLSGVGLIDHAKPDDDAADRGELVQSLQFVFDQIGQARERLQAAPRSGRPDRFQTPEAIHVLRR